MSRRRRASAPAAATTARTSPAARGPRVGLLVGLMILTTGLLWGGREARKVLGSARAVGAVVGTRPRPGGAGEPLPVVQFTTPEQVIVRFTPAEGDSVRPEIGRKVTVLYDPAQPEGARVEPTAWHWAAPLSLVLAGGFMTLVSLRLIRPRPPA